MKYNNYIIILGNAHEFRSVSANDSRASGKLAIEWRKPLWLCVHLLPLHLVAAATSHSGLLSHLPQDWIRCYYRCRWHRSSDYTCSMYVSQSSQVLFRLGFNPDRLLISSFFILNSYYNWFVTLTTSILLNPLLDVTLHTFFGFAFYHFHPWQSGSHQICPTTSLDIWGYPYNNRRTNGYLTKRIFDIFITAYMSKLAARLRMKTATKTDERVRIMDEIINGMQVI